MHLNSSTAQSLLKRCSTLTNKYKCPNCSVFTCSFICYRNHNSNTCFEQFCKKSIVEKLKKTKKNNSESKDFLEKCKKLYETREEDEYSQRLAFDEKREQLIQKIIKSNFDPTVLSSNENGLFSDFVNSLKLAPWKPIWEFPNSLPTNLITEISVDHYFEETRNYVDIIEELNLCEYESWLNRKYRRGRNNSGRLEQKKNKA